MRSILDRVNRYVVNRDPRSEASTGAKKPDVSFRKTMFIAFRFVVVCMVSTYSMEADTIVLNGKSHLAEGFDDFDYVVIDALVDGIHFLLQLVSKLEFVG